MILMECASRDESGSGTDDGEVPLEHVDGEWDAVMTSRCIYFGGHDILSPGKI